ncbi:DUF1648 domain-containing protein [Clostridium sp. JN-1]|uniref:DUF1648 domain-containing protein n=1 Tax=Clostridium sp. JN-1 TaxID=2483110 RepID=UPI000F0B11E4|nr:DUF1648 domain-containing protein [Clostridium sp. JN-1]
MKNDQFIFILFMSFNIFIIFIFQVLTPKLARKDIYFGVRIPEDKIDNDELKAIYKDYAKNNIITFILFMALMICFVYILPEYVYMIGTLSIFVYLTITFFVYYMSNKKVKFIKSQNKWFNGKKSMVVIDTNFSTNNRSKILVSPLWFLLCIAIIIVNIAIGFKYYSSLPYRVPTHFDFSGNPNGWMDKSYKVIWAMPAAQIFMTAIMFFSYKIIAWSKQQINPSNPEESQKRDKIFRHTWSKFMVVSCIVMNLLFTFGNLTIFQVIKLNPKISSIIPIVIAIVMVIFSVYVSIKIGQGGSRIDFNNGSKGDSKVSNIDDDKYWKLGNTIYVNKDDPALFVEKRFGIGWTMNFGRKESIIILAVFILLIVLLPIITS